VKLPRRLFDYVIWGALAVSVVLLLKHHRSSGPEEGTDAAPFDLPLLGSEGRFTLASQRGKPVVMEVFASWCGTCRRATPLLAETYRRHAGRDVAFVGVSVDESPRKAEEARAEWGIPYPVVLDDGSVSRDYAVSLLPTVVLIDKHGRVRRSVAGVPSKRELDEFLAEE
jgi:cytochrome c biogenesis protein CcmG/thiol:disulfide interchange protein DsbE